ncbi:hypothetical protein Dtox_0741 [Desulfofarcimen acetoxidans DSM 771]|uniref:Uncharacterized protein n=1 Tax=Desulfofarcimen acetoxidans (strain ATCC 49208 / DSM 771 / KCTC 5769 / VKM B-1644 / 5575) TaxID=485916 RepID=C8W1K8_DESAS|nr:hypothetical protein [Desulfofarcimen acetoxidans]ACV61653.1 hypothetical protein Dtox_0741 [Desulfofarcimen acetoxidans DSM 771]
MATASFIKDITIREPDAIKKFVNVISENRPSNSIDKEKASDKAMARAEKLLKQYLSR